MPPDNTVMFERLAADDTDEVFHGPSVRSKPGFIKRVLRIPGPPQIVVVAVLSSLSYGVIFGILPKLMVQRFAELNHGYSGDACESFDDDADKPDACRQGSAEAQNAHSFSELIANLLTIVTGAVVGDISDTHGRKELFVIATIAALLSNFGFIYVYLNATASPWIFYGLRTCHGLVSWTVVALASVADAVPPELRAPVVSLVMAGFFGGLCIGPIFAVILGRSIAVFFSCIVAVLAIVIAIVFVPETLKPEAAAEARRQKVLYRGEHQTPFAVAKYYLLSPFMGFSILMRTVLFRLVAVLSFFNGMVGAGDKILLLYYVDSVLSFTEGDTALMFLLYGMGIIIAQGTLVKPLTERFGEKKVVIMAVAVSALSNLSYGVARSKGTIFAGIALGSLAAVGSPIMAAILANNVNESEQGKMQGAFCSLTAVATGVGPVIMRFVDHVSRDSFLGPGAMFIFGAALQVIATYVTCLLPRHQTDSKLIHQAERGAAHPTETFQG